MPPPICGRLGGPVLGSMAGRRRSFRAVFYPIACETGGVASHPYSWRFFWRSCVPPLSTTRSAAARRSARTGPRREQTTVLCTLRHSVLVVSSSVLGSQSGRHHVELQRVLVPVFQHGWCRGRPRPRRQQQVSLHGDSAARASRHGSPRPAIPDPLHVLGCRRATTRGCLFFGAASETLGCKSFSNELQSSA